MICGNKMLAIDEHLSDGRILLCIAEMTSAIAHIMDSVDRASFAIGTIHAHVAEIQSSLEKSLLTLQSTITSAKNTDMRME